MQLKTQTRRASHPNFLEKQFFLQFQHPRKRNQQKQTLPNFKQLFQQPKNRKQQISQ